VYVCARAHARACVSQNKLNYTLK